MMNKQPPKQIYLQAYDSDSYDDNTWCVDRINDEDIEYILQSEYDQLKAEIERLQKYKEKLISDATQNEFVLLAYHDSLKEMKARVQELEALVKQGFHLSNYAAWTNYDGVLHQLIENFREKVLCDPVMSEKLINREV
jgi:Mg/Co/Ni transporter MgtE